LVDEYQDTNRLQSPILFGLKATGHGHTVVRDEAVDLFLPGGDGEEHF
jgi:DNA helicase II / ATP-dependent DNA helicase PcrA